MGGNVEAKKWIIIIWIGYKQEWICPYPPHPSDRLSTTIIKIKQYILAQYQTTLPYTQKKDNKKRNS
jgi:hypothetical protein